MPFVIAVAGKGGTGKTTLAALMVRSLLKTVRTPILAVDADPNTNFDAAVGLRSARSISDVLDETKGMRTVPANVPKTVFVQYQLEECLAEGRGMDLIVMGRPEGAGCYCAANHLLREYLDRLIAQYRYVVVDNEAGMEHISRRTTQKFDLLFVVSDPTLAGLRAARRIQDLVNSLDLTVRESALVLNRTDSLTPALEAAVREQNLHLAGTIPVDPLVAAYELEGRALVDLPDDAPAVRAAAELLAQHVSSGAQA
jgi:CO dehydrogenase maturation factor